LRRLAIAAVLVALAGCDGEEPTPARVAVPDSDDSPPSTTIVLRDTGGSALAIATQPPDEDHPEQVQLDEPRLRATAEGRDVDGGVARVRVSIREEILCRHPDGREEERPRTRYFPPSQIERIRSNPGARLPTSVSRTLPLALAGDRCGPGEPVAVDGELWGEAINGSGLEAVTPHLRFGWRRSPGRP
jgi:hypothetical protein